MKKPVRRLLAAALALATTPAFAQTYSQTVFFGDSLTDSGFYRPFLIENAGPGGALVLPGIVTNITAFGVFVDIGVQQDGLMHISELSDRFVRNPGDVVKVHQRVTVTVLNVDLQRKRISLSMKSGQTGAEATAKKEAVKPALKAETKRDKDDKKTKRFVNNPFYDAFRKK